MYVVMQICETLLSYIQASVMVLGATELTDAASGPKEEEEQELRKRLDVFCSGPTRHCRSADYNR